jgi:NADPH-dependent glutamate synthase beta subunit-like oxidoreductase
MMPCEVIRIAVGQDSVSKPWEDSGIPAKGNILQGGDGTQVKEIHGVFTDGDCATGPSTVIRAIAAGKVAAHNIDEYLGYHHTLDCGVTAPEARMNNRIPTGRVNIQERPANERKHDFEYVELPLTPEEIAQECGRCLRCDVFGCGKMEV